MPYEQQNEEDRFIAIVFVMFSLFIPINSALVLLTPVSQFVSVFTSITL